MKLELENRRVLITGASKGLGAQIARGFVAEGAVMTLCSRNREHLQQLQASLNAAPEQVWIHPMDATLEEEIVSTTAQAAQWMEGIDILINNVGGTARQGGFFDLTEDDWLDTYRRNVLSVMHFARQAHRFLRQGRNPCIININSLTALQPGVFNPHYSASKAAALNLNKHLANMFAADNILVNALIVGPFVSDSWEQNILRIAREQGISPEEVTQREESLARASIPLDRIGQGHDIAPMVLFLCSHYNRWTTGTGIVIDGGKLRGIH